MKIAKRIFLFVAVNFLIVLTLSTIMSLLGVRPYIEASGINYGSLMAFCLVWGFGGAFISLALSRVIAKWTTGVQLIGPQEHDSGLVDLRETVYDFAKKAGLTTMPEVGVYDSPDPNAFATGPTKSRSLVAVSTGLLRRMNKQQIEGVLAHEVAHIANGDMVTMTLVQGVVNAFVMFLARAIAWAASQAVEEERRHMVHFGVVFALEMVLGILGMLVVCAFSRAREFRADGGGAKLAGSASMIAALEGLQRAFDPETQAAEASAQPALAAMKISGKKSGALALFSTHPDLGERIEKLRQSAY